MTARHVLTILAVAELPAAAAFYDRAFGWPRPVDVPGYLEYQLPGGQRLGLYQREGFARNTGVAPHPTPAGGVAPTELYFHVDDLAAAIAAVTAAGGRLLSGLALRDWGERAAYFADPDGNVVVVAEPAAYQ